MNLDRKNQIDINEILSYRDMCNLEEMEQLQRGMSFNDGRGYSIALMSVRPNSPYEDKISADGMTIYYEGHDVSGDRLKQLDQPLKNSSGTITQNGKFATSIDLGKKSNQFPLVKVYEKIKSGIWTYRGLFEMRDYNLINSGGRKVFEFVFTISTQTVQDIELGSNKITTDLEQTRQIPGKIKLEVFKRDGGQCVQCGESNNLHFDHILPFSKGGTSLRSENIQILCARHNLQKSDHLDK